MSVDYWSACLALPPSKAKQVIRDLAPIQSCGAIVGPDEETFIEAWVGIQDIDVAAIAKQFGGERPSIDYWEGAGVDLPEEFLDLFENGKGLIMTNRSSALAGLDRVLALPNGVDVLGGHAVAHLPSKRIDSVKLRLTRLWKQLGGKDEAAEALQEYLFGNANDDAASKIITLLDNALDTAKAKKLDVIFISAVPP